MYSTEVTRHIRASRPAVYRALLDPEAVASWRVPAEMRAEVHEFAAREGGSFRVSLTYDAEEAVGKSEGRTDTYRGRFLKLVPDRQVVEEFEFETADPALRGTMTMTTTLTDAGDGTDVRVVHEGVPDAVPAADNETGTRMALANLARLVESRAASWDEFGDRLAARSIAAGDPTGWFDQLYAAGAAGEVSMPWNRWAPHPLLVEWAEARGLDGAGRRAVVVGCGLGADAEYVAGLGYDTVGFDIAETAVRLARERHPDTVVRYTTADLLEPPGAWVRAFDLVVEVITVQALPDPPRATAIVNVGRLVRPGGTLVAVAFRQEQAGAAVSGPPWPLRRDEIDAFGTDGLDVVRVEALTDPGDPRVTRWRAEFRRPPAPPW